ncbi:hypothetical protein CH063_00813 [Colletotrichum higginsianum]|uniref:Uncharacterized protein n=1 Tax=Colletotrichum higginsianum (strain IMI 349063) TaxID=759273 RepID=H1UX03_COLHI|nr:hypothetical protein CH63R_01371 [Colletotrichum higginsianum IMI 349063]OBR16191.1 hypothetical protein CH63R_01371 [Colletotrichum higginsianum IMI 349063]CCF32504.1 hypothetical protein CH063_00813 [Colletotrichum higginsianum]
MSSSIAIPMTPSSANTYHHHQSAQVQGATSSFSSTYSSSPRTSSPSSIQKQKMVHERRPSLLSSALSKQESTVINIGEPNGTPRLITYLSSSQGFAWNPEIFLPSYVDCDYVPLENRREPVHEIVLSDEEINNMFPQ